ncbi:hypothetical protein Tco_1207870, partial [Tanacetum coccineum]
NKNVIQHPCFTKLIIAYIMEKFESIPKRLKEDYHLIKDDTPLVSVYSTRNVTVRGILITDDSLTDAIRDTHAYKDYETEFLWVDVPTIQPELIESTQGTNRTPKATKTHNPADVKPKSTSTTPLPPSDDRERDEIHKATQLSLALDKTAKGENEESDGTEFTDRVFQSDDDFGDRIEPGSRKDKPEEVVVDDDDMEKKHDKKDDDDEDDDDD